MYDCMQLGKGRHCLIPFHMDILFKVLMQGVYVLKHASLLEIHLLHVWFHVLYLAKKARLQTMIKAF
jgi:hypothetical protein